MNHRIVIDLVSFAVCLLFAGVMQAADPAAVAPATDVPKTEKVLLYEVDPQSKTGDKPVDMKRLVAAVEQRVNTGWLRTALVEALPGERLKITVLETNDERVKRLARAVEAAGTMEFRILADRYNPDHKELIERAKKDDAAILHDAKDERKEKKWLAKWVPVKEGTEASFEGRGYAGIGKRERKLDAERTQWEILVVNDDFSVTGDYLVKTRAGTDADSSPCVSFDLNKKGGELFQGLTGAHLPQQDGQFTYKLGIILDGHLVSAPSIQSVIAERAQITGRFTKEEVDDLVGVLKAGALPVKLKRVESDGK